MKALEGFYLLFISPVAHFSKKMNRISAVLNICFIVKNRELSLLNII